MGTYAELTEDEANGHLTSYVATLPRRLAWLEAELAAGGGPTLDYTEEGLVPLWRWIREQKSFVDLGAPRDPDADLPLWFEFDEGFCADWGPRLLALVDGLVAYLAALYEKLRPGTRWLVHHAPKRVNSVDENCPVLAVGGEIEVNLPSTLSVMVTKTLIREPASDLDASDERLQSYFRIRMGSD